MSDRDAKRNAILTACAPVLLFIVIFNEIVEPSETVLMKVIVWWLIGMFLLAMVTLPMALYGYYNRHRIDTEEEEPLNYAPGMSGALLGTALVPLGRLLFDYFGID